MKKPLLFVLLVVSVAWSAQRFGVLPFQDRGWIITSRVRSISIQRDAPLPGPF